MNIIFFNEDVQMPQLDFNKIELWVNQIVKNHQKQTGDINYIFCSDEYLLEINKKYLNHDYFTDIVSFNYCEGNIVSGDIFISLDRVGENAIEFQTLDTEMLRVLIHGVLHLIGLDDQTTAEKQIMRLAEDTAIQKFIE